MRWWQFEWPTLGLILGVYVGFLLATTVLYQMAPVVAVIVLALAIVLHSSLMHEVLHGHPTGNEGLNTALIFANIGLFVPYLRFKDTHLEHHRDENLTDPYDDPESNYCDPAVWALSSSLWRSVLRFNNTLFGRMLIGPLIGQFSFMLNDAKSIINRERRVLLGWLIHVPAVLPVLYWIAYEGAMPVALYLTSAYIALSILKIRTFLEHRAHPLARGRSVVIEQQCIFSFLFLNNSYHAVHHAHPKIAWYHLPAKFAAHRERYLAQNEGYSYTSYKAIFGKYMFTAKDPVAHPIWTKDQKFGQ